MKKSLLSLLFMFALNLSAMPVQNSASSQPADVGITYENGDIVDQVKMYEASNNSAYLCNKILRLWEIRSLVHFNDPNLFNSDQSDWGHHRSEPFFGSGPASSNPFFSWAKTIKPTWAPGVEVPLYFSPTHKYRLLTTFTSSSDYIISSSEGSRNHSTGILLVNTTDNDDGNAEKILYIAFRETTSPQQLIAWISVSPNKVIGDNGEAVLASLWDYVYDIRDKNGNPAPNNIRSNLIKAILQQENVNHFDKIIVTGMSLGGALAYCAAYDLSLMYPGKVEFFGFASPRIGNAEFARTLQKNLALCVRIEADNDDNVIGYKKYDYGFRHAGIPIRLTESGNISLNFTDIRSTYAYLVGKHHRRDYYYSRIFKAHMLNNSEQPLPLCNQLISR